MRVFLAPLHAGMETLHMDQSLVLLCEVFEDTTLERDETCCSNQHTLGCHGVRKAQAALQTMHILI